MDKLDTRTIMNHPLIRNHIDSLEESANFKLALDEFVNNWKLEAFQEAFPEDFTIDQTIASILLNLEPDYDSLIKDLPQGFNSAKDENCIHVGNTNQIGIYFDGEVVKGVRWKNGRVACLSFHFRDLIDEQNMCLENVQGELKDTNYSKREIRRIYGKLNTHFKEGWQVGLLRQAVEYAKVKDMRIKGIVPGVFSFFGDSRAEYPMYSLNYVRNYLRVGIPLEDIEFRQNVYNEDKGNWETAIEFLNQQDPTERLRRLDLAFNYYSQKYNKIKNKWLNDESIKNEDYVGGCKREFDRVFKEILS